jgi:hypothetical protein
MSSFFIHDVFGLKKGTLKLRNIDENRNFNKTGIMLVGAGIHIPGQAGHCLCGGLQLFINFAAA